uniref:Uncharacterized protein n=1 Tax=Glossina pallidipes TaxID=7398 RepID=A0A1A9Z0R3_GLOPL
MSPDKETGAKAAPILKGNSVIRNCNFSKVSKKQRGEILLSINDDPEMSQAYHQTSLQGAGNINLLWDALTTNLNSSAIPVDNFTLASTATKPIVYEIKSLNDLVASHHPIALLGGATALIGDPSHRKTERSQLKKSLAQRNLEGIKQQLMGIFENHQRIVNKEPEKRKAQTILTEDVTLLVHGRE